jgi:hypothetical protein
VFESGLENLSMSLDFPRKIRPSSSLMIFFALLNNSQHQELLENGNKIFEV